jgi:hypothetical protein
MTYLDTTERFNEQKQLSNTLEEQMRAKRNEQERKRVREREEELRLQSGPSIDPNKCPHGKKYICSHCEKSYPRNYLSKRQLKSY